MTAAISVDSSRRARQRKQRVAAFMGASNSSTRCSTSHLVKKKASVTLSAIYDRVPAMLRC